MTRNGFFFYSSWETHHTSHTFTLSNVQTLNGKKNVAIIQWHWSQWNEQHDYWTEASAFATFFACEHSRTHENIMIKWKISAETFQISDWLVVVGGGETTKEYREKGLTMLNGPKQKLGHFHNFHLMMAIKWICYSIVFSPAESTNERKQFSFSKHIRNEIWSSDGDERLLHHCCHCCHCCHCWYGYVIPSARVNESIHWHELPFSVTVAN